MVTDACVFWHGVRRVEFTPVAWPVDRRWYGKQSRQRGRIMIGGFTARRLNEPVLTRTISGENESSFLQLIYCEAVTSSS